MASFEEQMQTACQDGSLPGAVIVATNISGSFKYQKAFGKSDIPYELDTPFKLMSCTKFVTSICALQCVEKGLIGLDDNVSKHLPALVDKVLISCDDGKEPVFEELQAPVTLRLLMTHSAGTVMGQLNPALANYRKRTGTADKSMNGATVEERFAVPLGFQPGSDWEYGSGHDWAAKLVENLTGTDLDSYIKANVAPQLGITTMTFWPQKNGLFEKIPVTMIRENTDFLKGLVTGKYDPMAKLIPHPHNEWDNLDNKKDCFGGSGLTCSATDYIKILHSTLANDGKLLKPETVDRIFVGALPPAAKAALNAKFIKAGFSSLAPGEYAENVELDWGLGAMLMLDGTPGWRGKRTLMWTGLTNLFWFIDRENDLCGLFATQLFPSGDDRAAKIITLWEKEMHRLVIEAQTKAQA